MIEYVVEESVRPDGAIRWVVTDMTNMTGAPGSMEQWSAFSEEEGLVIAVARARSAAVIRVGTRDGRHKDYGVKGAQQRIEALRKAGATVANHNSTYNATLGTDCDDCGRDISMQAADLTKLYMIKHRTTLCLDCADKRGPGTPNQRHPQPATEYTLMGVKFIIGVGSQGVGQFWWSDADQAWITTQNTYDGLRAGSNTDVQRQISALRQARREGRAVVKATVTHNPRRPAPAIRPRKGDLHDLVERTKRMVVQIATMSDKGPIPDGQVSELSKTYAALQSEFDEAMGEVEEIKDNLSIMRAIMFEHSDPRNASDAIA